MASARQKQVDDALARALERRPREPRNKIQCAVQDGVVVMLHHQHEVLRYRLPNEDVDGEAEEGLGGEGVGHLAEAEQADEDNQTELHRAASSKSSQIEKALS